ncbi:HelD family protein [Cohnella nanjingensis]|uniref:DNA 3'-5' helicase n=1 Tax=Cohnella nanjingensis TaxID=1387779 RepID=A0A7X0VCT8_9BACL|nr:3'-5' exonuclease [Cohnella nanjingensis]MBB6669235.1 AAA family ATPase [Cohnella nanjingensis]
MSEDEKFQEERTKLSETLAEIRSQIAGIGPRYTGKDYTEQLLDAHRQDRKARLEIAQREPYFGRLDFRERGKRAPTPLYIGKTGIGEEDGTELLVVDWRAPVSSLFYAFAGGDPDVSYASPDGEVEGTIYLKRNLLIRQGDLQRVVDSYTEGSDHGAVTDEFLLHKLGESKDNKLRDIVSTIQQEQDAIIRTEKNKAVFIQGVAGSGKTTVALHRLAYLLYRYQDRVRADRMMILAPSTMFLNYISGVLPELGVGDINQTTFEDWALDQLGGDVALRDPAEALERWFERPVTEADKRGAHGRAKGDLGFLKEIDDALAELAANLIPDEPFSPDDRLSLPAATIRGWFSEELADDPIMKKRERLLNRLKRWMEIEIGRERWSDRAVKTQAAAKWKAYANKVPSYTAASFYAKSFPEAVGAISAKGAKRKLAPFDREDLAPLVYIHARLYGTNTPAYDHIVIDEAQDYSPVQLAVLKERQRIASMTVLGDLQQGIHDYAGVSRWSELTDVFPEGETAYFELDRSYRSTMEIIEFANRVLAGMSGGVKPARPVFRSGDAVETVRTDEAETAGAIAATVKAWRERPEIQSVAVLARTAAACERIHEGLRRHGIEASLLQAKNQQYEGGVTVVPVYLSKGLEFDAVLIPDADAEQYGSGDAKLLYVGCTRALHLLKLMYRRELTGLVREPSAEPANGGVSDR